MSDIKEQIQMCREVAHWENTEVSYALAALCDAAEGLLSLSDNKNADVVIKMAIALAKSHLEWAKEEDWEYYDEQPAEVYQFFLGEPKMTKKEYFEMREWEYDPKEEEELAEIDRQITELQRRRRELL